MVGSSASGSIDGRTLRHQHRRPQLLALVTEYVLDHGILDLSLRPMALALGVTHATLIRHFRSKDNLIHEVVDQIREDFFTALEENYQFRDATTVRQFLGTAWELLKHPTEQRQFLLLFEVVALATRHPDSLGDISHRIVQDWLTPLEELLVKEGRSAEEATTIATLALAQVRGLQLDLLLSGDRSRADAAFELAMTQIPLRTIDRT